MSSHADFNLEIRLGKDKRMKKMRYEECAYGDFIRKLKIMFRLQTPIMENYKLWYQLQNSIEWLRITDEAEYDTAIERMYSSDDRNPVLFMKISTTMSLFKNKVKKPLTVIQAFTSK